MTLSITQIIEQRQPEQYGLDRRYINPRRARVQAIIGPEKTHTRGQRAYLKLFPPLIIGEEEVEMMIAALEAVMAEAAHVRRRVWRLRGRLIGHAMAR